MSTITEPVLRESGGVRRHTAAAALRRNSRRTMAVWALTLLVITGGLRLYRLGGPSLWGDELATISGALGLDIPPVKVLGYLPTRWGLQAMGLGALEARDRTGWRAAGLSEFRARLPSAIVGILAVPVIYLALRGMLPGGAALLVAFMLSLSPWHVHWSQSARFYILQSAFYSLALVWYWRAVGMRRWVDGAWTAAFTILAILSQPTAAIILAVFAMHLGFLWWRGEVRPTRRLVVAAVGLVVLVGGLIGRDIVAAPAVWLQFFTGANHPPLRHLAAIAWYVQPAVLVAGLLSWVHLWRAGEPLAPYLLIAGVLPPLAFTAVGLFGFVEPRYSFVCLLPWLVLAGWGAWRAFSAVRPVGGILLASVAPALLLAVQATALADYYVSGGYRSRVREAFAHVADRIQPGELVCTERQEGEYYLGRAVDVDIWTQRKRLYQLQQPTWIICGPINHGYPSRRWLEANAEFKATFDTSIVGPDQQAHVYWLRPAPVEGRP